MYRFLCCLFIDFVKKRCPSSSILRIQAKKPIREKLEEWDEDARHYQKNEGEKNARKVDSSTKVTF